MVVMFKHFIITRFNLKYDVWAETKNNESVLSSEWLEHRFHLFTTFCLPSVKNQSNQNFIWYVFFNSDTPADYVSKITEMSVDYRRLKPIFVDGMKYFHDSLLSNIKADISDEDKYIITTRLDNDDGIHMNFTDTIQNCFAMQDDCIVDIIDGYQIIVNDLINACAGVVRCKFNPFISLIESAEKPRSIMTKMHNEWVDSKDIITIENRRLWFLTVHDKNLSNRIDSTFRYSNCFYKNEFGLDHLFLPFNSFWKVGISFIKSKIYLSCRYLIAKSKHLLCAENS